MDNWRRIHNIVYNPKRRKKGNYETQYKTSNFEGQTTTTKMDKVQENEDPNEVGKTFQDLCMRIPESCKSNSKVHFTWCGRHVEAHNKRRREMQRDQILLW